MPRTHRPLSWLFIHPDGFGWIKGGLRSCCVVAATRYGPDSCRPAAAGDKLVDAVRAAAITASSPPPRNSCYYTSNHGLCCY